MEINCKHSLIIWKLFNQLYNNNSNNSNNNSENIRTGTRDDTEMNENNSYKVSNHSIINIQ